MSLVDYGFYSDEEEEEEEREGETSQQQESRVAGSCRNSHSSNGSVADTSFHPHATEFQPGSKKSASEGSPHQLKGTEAFCVEKEEEAAEVRTPSARKKRSIASLVRLQQVAEDSPSVDPSAFCKAEEEAEKAATSPAAVREAGGRAAAAAQAPAGEEPVAVAGSNDTTAPRGSAKRARENRSIESSAAASSSSTASNASLLQRQELLQPGGTDSSTCVKQQLSGTLKLRAADCTAAAANKATPPPNVGREQDAARLTAVEGTSCLAAVPSPAPLPALPSGEAPKELLDAGGLLNGAAEISGIRLLHLRTVERLRQLRARGITVNGNIAASLDFKNPYLLEKIMKVFDIDPYCSNYPVSVFDPNNVIPWEPRTGTPFAVHLVRRFEQRRQQRREIHSSKEGKEDAAAGAVNSAAAGTHTAAPAATATSGAAAGSGASAGTQQAAAALPAEASDAPPEGSTHRPRSRFERISPPAAAGAQQQQHTAAPAPGFSSTAGLPSAAPLGASAGFNAALQQAAFEAMAKAGAMASVVQHQLQQRLLTMHSALAQQQQHCASMATRDASSAAALAAAAAAAAVSYRSQQQPPLQQQQAQQNGPVAVGPGSNHQRPSGLPLISAPAASHAATALCGGASSSSTAVVGSVPLQSGAAVASSGPRSGDSSGGAEDECFKINKVDVLSVRQRLGETAGAAATGPTAQQQQRSEPTHRRQTASIASSTRWGNSRGE